MSFTLDPALSKGLYTPAPNRSPYGATALTPWGRVANPRIAVDAAAQTERLKQFEAYRTNPNSYWGGLSSDPNYAQKWYQGIQRSLTGGGGGQQGPGPAWNPTNNFNTRAGNLWAGLAGQGYGGTGNGGYNPQRPQFQGGYGGYGGMGGGGWGGGMGNYYGGGNPYGGGGSGFGNYNGYW